MTKDEELLLDIVSNNDCEEYNKCIDKYFNEFILEQLSHMRGNLFEWLPIEDKNVLEINGCYGAISETLKNKVKKLDVLVFDETEYEICNKRLGDYSNTSIELGNINELSNNSNPYDFILIGNPYFTSVEQFVEDINRCKNLAVKGGKICVALDNKYGLKYFNAAYEPNSKKRFYGIEGYKDYSNSRCFSFQEINKALEAISNSDVRWFYPYPDRMFPLSIYTEDYLPKKGELTSNMRRFEKPNMTIFDENQVWDNLIDDGLFQQFSNSYLLLIEV